MKTPIKIEPIDERVKIDAMYALSENGSTYPMTLHRGRATVLSRSLGDIVLSGLIFRRASGGWLIHTLLRNVVLMPFSSATFCNLKVKFVKRRSPS